jgi:hypothetical protein
MFSVSLPLLTQTSRSPNICQIQKCLSLRILYIYFSDSSPVVANSSQNMEQALRNVCHFLKRISYESCFSNLVILFTRGF